MENKVLNISILIIAIFTTFFLSGCSKMFSLDNTMPDDVNLAPRSHLVMPSSFKLPPPKNTQAKQKIMRSSSPKKNLKTPPFAYKSETQIKNSKFSSPNTNK